MPAFIRVICAIRVLTYQRKAFLFFALLASWRFKRKLTGLYLRDLPKPYSLGTKL